MFGSKPEVVSLSLAYSFGVNMEPNFDQFSITRLSDFIYNHGHWSVR